MPALRPTIAIVGNPNCGKSTLFNGLTGSDQRVGNWPGVTIERKEGHLDLGAGSVTVVDLPGIYALAAASEDERVARDYILSGEPALVVDVVDATNLERNLYLTTQLLDMGAPLVLVLTMADRARAAGMEVDTHELARQLGCPVVAVDATRKQDLRAVVDTIARAWDERRSPRVVVPQRAEVEALATEWAERLDGIAGSLGARGRWLALKVIERDPWAVAVATGPGGLAPHEAEDRVAALEDDLGECSDILLAEGRYAFIEAVAAAAVVRPERREGIGDRIDRVVLHRVFGLPVFLGVMYVLFWFSVSFGGAFIDAFDMIGGALFVDGPRAVMEAVGLPETLITVLADGIGAGLQITVTFVPIVFAMFLGLSLLEDSGYMARAAFVMDRFLRWIGLPGKSFVPMLLGFGCNVPAIMSTRTLDSPRDRYLTIFMNPFMSCGARLPVYALFGAAFFGAAAGAMTFSLYGIGLAVAILTGLLMKNTLFRGEPTYFVMELPPYHRPRARAAVGNAWQRLVMFLGRAKIIVPIVALLAVLNSMGTDGTFGNEDTSDSVLSAIGRTVTPVFEPMGVEEDNWEATVAIFTGILAKETVVGTLNSLYTQVDDPAADTNVEPAPYDFPAAVGAALATIPANLATLPGSLTDPFGFGVMQGSTDEVAAQVGASSSALAGLQQGFTGGGAQVYAYLLFVLLYLPCVSAFGAMTREMGMRHTLMAVAYIGVVSWSMATLFYQVALGGSLPWIVVSLGLLAGAGLVFWILGVRERAATSSRVTLPGSAAAAG
jgi:ferrous iron transport protein B